jgi:hypothetical protein
VLALPPVFVPVRIFLKVVSLFRTRRTFSLNGGKLHETIWRFLFLAAVVALCLGTMLVRSPQVRAQNDNNQGNQGNDDESKIKQGFAIAPVKLNLEGKNRALVGLGSYIVNAQGDCNGCHTLSPAAEYTASGNPYLLSPPFSGKVTVDPTHYLAGGQDFGPFPGGPGSIPHLYSRNLTPDKTGLPEGGIRLRSSSRSSDTVRISITFIRVAVPAPLPTAYPFRLMGTFCR